MSTYLLAFIVGEYDFVERKAQSGTVVRVYTPIKKTYMGNFSLDVKWDDKSDVKFGFEEKKKKIIYNFKCLVDLQSIRVLHGLL